VIAGEGALSSGGDALAISMRGQAQSFCNYISLRNKMLEWGTQSTENVYKYAKLMNEEVHHIIGQGWRNKDLSRNLINNFENVISTSRGTHGQITQFFNRGKNFYDFLGKTNFRTLGEYVSSKSWQKQFNFGLKILDYALENSTLDGFVVGAGL
jgi:hypothetical protein